MSYSLLNISAPVGQTPLKTLVDLHPRLDLARTRGHQDSRTFELHDAHAANVDRSQGLELAQGRRVDLQPAASVEDGRALEHVDLLAVDADLDKPLGLSDEHNLSH